MNSFACAIKGIVRVFREERHMRIHCAFAFYVVAAGIITGISVSEWGVVLSLCGAVMALECVNTAVERLCDRVTEMWDARIGFAKDASAGAVLVCAVFAAAAGLIIFLSGGRVRTAIEFFKNPIAAVLLIASIVFWILTIFRRTKK
jgi:diacylglycerol kinase (ATP)